MPILDYEAKESQGRYFSLVGSTFDGRGIYTIHLRDMYNGSGKQGKYYLQVDGYLPQTSQYVYVNNEKFENQDSYKWVVYPIRKKNGKVSYRMSSYLSYRNNNNNKPQSLSSQDNYYNRATTGYHPDYDSESEDLKWYIEHVENLGRKKRSKNNPQINQEPQPGIMLSPSGGNVGFSRNSINQGVTVYGFFTNPANGRTSVSVYLDPTKYYSNSISLEIIDMTTGRRVYNSYYGIGPGNNFLDVDLLQYLRRGVTYVAKFTVNGLIVYQRKIIVN